MRPESFPERWSLRSVLMTDIVALDATVYREAGRWWMFATVMLEHDSSSSDTVSLFWADTIEGPMASSSYEPREIRA